MTEKLFYVDAYMKEFDATVISCESKGDKWVIVLDKTAFYPEGGGQPTDVGTLEDVLVQEVHEKDGIILHTTDKPIQPGTKVHGVIDWERRFDHMQQHSGEHIVSGMLCESFHCDNVGFHMGSEIIQIDYNADIPWEEALKIEERANEYIRQDHPFVELWPAPEELTKLEYRSKKALTGAVRIASFPGADMCACCGTHVKSSAQVGLVKLLSCQKMGDGVRIEMLSGKRAFDYLATTWDQNQMVSRELSATPKATAEAVKKLKEEMMRLKGQLSASQDSMFEMLTDKHIGEKDPVIFVGDMESDSVRKLCDMLAEKATGRCCVFAGKDSNYKYSVIHKDNDIKDLIKEMNTALNGRGGGRNGFAQGSINASRNDVVIFFSQK